MGGARVGDERPALLSTLQVDIPGLALNFQVQFGLRLKTSDTALVAEAVEEVVSTFAEELGEDVDKQGTEQKLALLKEQALKGVEDWSEKLKAVETWRSKVDRATAQLTKMREAYLKEVTFLKEQLYEKGKAERDGRDFEPKVAIHFNPSGYTLDDEGCAAMSRLRLEFEAQLEEEREKSRARINTLNDQLATAKLTVSRKELLLARVRKGQDENEKEPIAADIECIAGQSPTDAEEGTSERDLLRQHLESKFGCLEGAARELSLKYGDVDRLGFEDFSKLLEGVGYQCDVGCLFALLRPSHVALADILGRGAAQQQPEQEPERRRVRAQALGYRQARQAPGRAEGRRAPSSGSTALLRGPQTADHCVGTGPYEACFGKAELCNAGVQTLLDSRTLDKATDYYDKLAEQTWKELLATDQLAGGEKEDTVSEAGSDVASSVVASLYNEELPSNRPFGREIDEPDEAFRRCISAPCQRNGGGEHSDGDRCASSSVAPSPAGGSLTVQLPVAAKPTSRRPPRRMGSRRRSEPNLQLQAQAAGAGALAPPSAAAALSAAADTAERGTQCAMGAEDRAAAQCPAAPQQGALQPAAECRSRGSEDPHEAQLQSVEDMATAIEQCLPELRAQAAWLLHHMHGHVGGGGKRERGLLDRISSLAGKPKPASPTEMRQSFRAPRDSEGICEILSRHGVKLSVAAEGFDCSHAAAKPPASKLKLRAVRAASATCGTGTSMAAAPLGRRTLVLDSALVDEEASRDTFLGERAKTAALSKVVDRVQLLQLMRKRMEFSSESYCAGPLLTDRTSRHGVGTLDSLPSNYDSGADDSNASTRVSTLEASPHGPRRPGSRFVPLASMPGSGTPPAMLARPVFEKSHTGPLSARAVLARA